MKHITKIYLSSFKIILAALLFCSVAHGQVATYTFSQTAGVYTPVTGGNVLGDSATDDNNFAAIPIGFSFYYNGQAYTNFSVNANGYIVLGNTVANSQTVLSSGSNNNAVSALNYDLQARLGAELSYLLSGTAPNRSLTVQWKNYRAFGAATDTLNFQIHLNESTNGIDLSYGRCVSDTIHNAQVGIRGSSNADVSNRYVSDTSNTWATSTAGLTNTAACKIAPGFAPASGQVYSWLPPAPPAAPISISFTAVTPTSITVNWVDNSSNEASFVVYQSTDNITFTLAKTVASTTAATTGTAYSVNMTGLNSGVTYYFRIYAVGMTPSATYLPGNSATIAGTICGTFSIGPTGTYPSIKSALAALQTSGLSCSVILELQAAYVSTVDTFPLSVPFLGTTVTSTLTLRPETGATNLSIISNSAQTFDFNGSAYFTIDGRAGGTGSTSNLLVYDSSLTGNTFRFVNDAHHNTLNYLVIKGATTGGTTNAVIQFGNSATSAGNSNNTISNCEITGSSTPPQVLIYSANNTVGAASVNNILSHNLLHDWFAAGASNYGINLGTGNSTWSIMDNSFYQTSIQTYTTGATHAAINIGGGGGAAAGNGFIISGNYIGGAAPLCGGAAWAITGNVASRFNGISLNAGTVSTSSIQGNIIRNLNLNTLGGGGGPGGAAIWTGINISGGNVNAGTITGNTIGSTTGTNDILTSTGTSGSTTYGINSSSNGIVNISGNNIGGISALANTGTTTTNLIGIQASAGTMTITNNMIGSRTANNSLANAPSTGTGNNQVAGIYTTNTNTCTISDNTIMNISNTCIGTGTGTIVRGIGTTGGVNTITSNSVKLISNASPQNGTGTNASVQGISQTSGQAGQMITSNTIHTLLSGAIGGNSALTGIYYAGGNTSGNTISKNRISAIGAPLDTIAPTITGIQLNNGSVTADNNMITLGTDSAGTVYPLADEYTGILKSGTGNTNVFFNSVNITGTTTGTAGTNTFSFRRTGTAVDTLKNNIFSNFRSNAGTGGIHYSIATNNATTLISDHNDLFGNGNGYTLGSFNNNPASSLSGWTTASGLDSNSVSVNPNYISALNLHINNSTSSGLESRGVAAGGITSDIDGDVRPGPAGSIHGGASAPDIGADEFDGIPVTVDMGAVALTAPLLNACHTSSETVAVSVRNYSTQTIDFSVDSLQLFVSVTGINPLTFPVARVNTGTLAAGATLNIVVSNSYNMSVAGTYIFHAYSVTHADLQPGNDTMADVTIHISGGTVSSPSLNVCSGVPVTLTLTGTTGGSLQWQQSGNLTSWTNLAGDTMPVISVSPVSNTYYRAITCGVYISTVDSLHVISISPPTGTGASRCGIGQVSLHASGATPILWFDSLSGGSVLDTGAVFNPTIQATTTFFVASSGNPSPINNLATAMTGTLSSGGNMFTIRALNNITITGFDGHTSGGTSSWSIYYRPDDFTRSAGSNLNPAGWILLGSDTGVVSAGTGNPTPIPIPLNVTIPAGSTYSFYVMVTAGQNVNYSTGDSLGFVNTSNADLQVYDGYAGTTFNCNRFPRAFNGVVHYFTSCISNRTPVVATVTPAIPFSLSASSSAVCSGDSVQLQAFSSNSNYQYSWSPSTGLSDTTGSAVWATLNLSSTFYVNAVDTVSGCASTDSIFMIVREAPHLSLSVNNDTICTGDTLHLSVTVPGNFRFGTGNTSNNGTSYPAPYGNSSWGARHQMLVLAEEMQTAGMAPGYINSLSFNVSNANGAALVNFSISIGGTSVTALTDNFLSIPMLNVYSASSYTPVNGINTHPFALQYYWDGISNILVETCFNDTNSTTNTRTRWSTTSFPSCTYFHANTALNCGAPVGTVSTQRPNMIFGIQNQYSVHWISSAPLSDPSVTQPYSVPSVSATYHVTVTDTLNGCFNSDSVFVLVHAHPVVSLGPDTSACGSFILDAGNNGSSFLWSNSSTSQSISVTSTGTYAVLVTDSFSCSAVDSIGLVINTLPAVTLTLPFDSLCTLTGITPLGGGTPAGGTFSGTGVTGTDFNPAVAGAGTIAVHYSITDTSNGCSNTATDSIVVVICTAAGELTSSGQLRVFPNPLKDDFVVELPAGGTGYAQIISPEGKIIKEWNLTGATRYPLTLDRYSPGLYFMKIIIGNEMQLVKLVKQD